MGAHKIEFASASTTRIKLTKEQEKAIYAMYKDLAKQIEKEVAAINRNKNVSSVLRTMYLKGLAKQVNQELSKMSKSQSSLILKNMTKIAEVTLRDTTSFMSKGVELGINYSRIADDVVKEIASGNIYKGRWDLSSAIWKDIERTQQDIDYIVAQGVAANKGSYEIAKDIEKYIDPAAKKEWEWAKVYPGTKRVVDYSAQRLARTMVSHAYQDSFVRGTHDNPFVEAYQWMTSNSDRVCDVCMERAEGWHGVVIDGEQIDGAYYVDDLPLDHPNGMCDYAVLTGYTFKDIAAAIRDWDEGKGDPEMNKQLDKFYEKLK